MNQILKPLETDKGISWDFRLNLMEISEKIVCKFAASATARTAIWKIHNMSDKRFVTKKNGLVVNITRIN